MLNCRTHMAIPILILISALSIFSVCSAEVFVSIDCGSSESYTDENSIVWAGDEGYIQNGESHTVHDNYTVSTVVTNTLRAFTTRNKNCYSIEASKGERVLIRATFYYGNYDNKSSPPAFGLMHDGNVWARVETSMSEYVYYEAMYVLKGDYVSVCVAQIEPDQFPFISALEVRSLLPTMYDTLHHDYPLYLLTRYAYGTNATIRYADDPYDRIWAGVGDGDGLISVKSDAVIEKAGVPDEPPPAVLRNAVSAVSPNTSIRLSMGISPSSGELSVYLNMYFSEVMEVGPTQKRSFLAAVDGVSLLDLDDPIIPPYGNCTQLRSKNLTVSSNTTLVLIPNKDATLPPLINAMEVLQIGSVLANGTHATDVSGLASLQLSFAVLQGWSGDPCLPYPFSWDWINCTTDPIPRVTALYLGSYNLSGALPDFSAMDALETIDFHNNSLAGPIPEFLSKLLKLKQLNLASNNFSGPIPESLSRKTGLNLVVTGNPDLQRNSNSSPTPPTNSPSGITPSSSSSINKIGKLGALILGAFVIIL